MNELTTPQGYAEYPRDPKFRKPDEFDRLASMAGGYRRVREAFGAFIPLFWPHSGTGHLEWPWVLADIVLPAALFFWIRPGLARIFVAKEWKAAHANGLLLACTVLMIVHRLAIWPFAATLILSGLSYGALMYFASEAVTAGFRNYGFKVPRDLSEKNLPVVAQELRDSQAPAGLQEVG